MYFLFFVIIIDNYIVKSRLSKSRRGNKHCATSYVYSPIIFDISLPLDKVKKENTKIPSRTNVNEKENVLFFSRKGKHSGKRKF